MEEKQEKNLQRTTKYSADSDLAMYEEMTEIVDNLEEIAGALKGVEYIRQKGPKGDKGDKGDIGPEGKQGPQGIQGPKGDKGDRGEQGPQGLIGVEGPMGLTGPMGPQGPKGENGKDGKDGKDADIEFVIGEVVKRSPKVTQPQGGFGPNGIWNGSANPFVVKSAGVEIGKDIRSINFAGAGVASVVNNNGDVTVTIQTGGGGSNFETPSGTVNGSNQTFTATQTPLYVVSDGVTYFQNNGYTLSGLTITMDIAPSSFIRSAY